MIDANVTIIFHDRRTAVGLTTKSDTEHVLIVTDTLNCQQTEDTFESFTEAFDSLVGIVNTLTKEI